LEESEWDEEYNRWFMSDEFYMIINEW